MQQDLHIGKYINPALQYIFFLLHCEFLKSFVSGMGNSLSALENELLCLSEKQV